MNPLFAASGLESLITLLVFIGIAVVSTWLKKKQKPEDEKESWSDEQRRAGPTATRPQVPRPAKPSGWEEELRRLLEGDEPTAQPPPVIVYETPRPAPRTGPPAPPPVPRLAPVIVQDEGDEMEKGLPVRMPSLTQSERAYQRASRLDISTAEHLRQISERIATHAAKEAATHPAPAPHPAVSLIRNRVSLQSAIVASILLGPPKALESRA